MTASATSVISCQHRTADPDLSDLGSGLQSWTIPGAAPAQRQPLALLAPVQKGLVVSYGAQVDALMNATAYAAHVAERDD